MHPSNLRGDSEAAAGSVTESAPETASVSTATEHELIDGDNLDQLRQMSASGQEGFVARVAGLFLEHAPAALRAIQDSEAQERGRAAHALKSMSYSLGASRTAELAAAIEIGQAGAEAAQRNLGQRIGHAGGGELLHESREA